MKILVIGSGGREHAIVWKLLQSKKVNKIYCAPGNAGIKSIAECVDINASDIPALLVFAEKNKIDLTVVGPEDPLAKGITEIFLRAGLRIWGPSQKAAMIEGSKLFSKRLMEKYNIPTGYFKGFTDPEMAKKYISEKGAPIVIKADGLAAGKGVIIAQTIDQAFEAVDTIMIKKAFGNAGNHLLVEEFLEGEEASFLIFTDGKHITSLPTSQDHKAIYDGDKGPNTGGMGAYSPAPVIDKAMHETIMETIMRPTVRAMEKEGYPYKGVLYAGLMITEDGPKVLEFNARFGDPEAQPLLMLLKTDLIDILEACIDGNLDKIAIGWHDGATVCVVMANKGYPGQYEKGQVIGGLDKVSDMDEIVAFHAGTSLKDKNIIATGGRVLGVTAKGANIAKAIDNAYKAVSKIRWDGVYFRKDIGRKALNRLN